MEFLAPITLTGTRVSLSPLSHDDVDELAAASADGDLSSLQYTGVPTPENMGTWVDTCLTMQESGTFLPWVTRRLDTGTPSVIGMTTFCNVEPAHRRVEIGYTWNAASAQRSGTNTESKLLLLTHAFETLDCIAVEFRTHWLNRQSRAAIERLGAKLDGVLRNHRLSPDGTLRDTAAYSILPHEWPAIRAELQRRLQAQSPGAMSSA
ncbi:GNAT family N-acetyltransferase [Aeromicrobium sp. CF3.5]|uniref:GNAT family N-acetyltransferase n=1 Tax=Aeromicrobium sp. CF3.5 TaxID=3373078 RepID=UPI003EE707FF